MIYHVFMVLSLAFSLLELNPKYKRYYCVYFGLLSLFFIGISGLTSLSRQDVGAGEGYLEIFQSPITVEYMWGFGVYEPLFLLLCSFFSSFELFIFAYMIINWFFLSKIVKRYSPYICLSLFVYISSYYLLGPMGQIRQAIAVSIIIYAWKFIGNKRFFFWVIIASLFHYSAIICIILFFIPNTLIKAKYCVLLLGITVVFYLSIQNVFVEILTNVTMLDSGIVSGKLSYYLLGESNQLSVSLLLYKLFLFALLLWKRFSLLEFELFPKLFNMYVVSILLWISLSFSGTIAGRFTIYFSISELLLIPYLFYSLRTEQMRYIIIPVILVLNIYMYYSFLFKFSDVYIPYKSFLL